MFLRCCCLFTLCAAESRDAARARVFNENMDPAAICREKSWSGHRYMNSVPIKLNGIYCWKLLLPRSQRRRSAGALMRCGGRCSKRCHMPPKVSVFAARDVQQMTTRGMGRNCFADTTVPVELATATASRAAACGYISMRIKLNIYPAKCVR